MNVASLELCKELYELSGWKTARGNNQYHLGFLLARLPSGVFLEKNSEGWRAGVAARSLTETYAEDAVAKLCIELFKQGILKEDNLDA